MNEMEGIEMRSAGVRRLARLGLALAMMSWGLTVSGTGPVAAQEPPGSPAPPEGEIEVVPSPLALRLPSGAAFAGGSAGAAFKAHIAGEPGAQVTLAQCVLPVGATQAASRCGPGTPVVLDEHGVGTADGVLAQTLQAPTGTVSCVSQVQAPRCAIAAFDSTGDTLGSDDVFVRSPVPISLSTSPPDLWSLVDGQEVEVVVTGRPEIPVRVAQCRAPMPPGSTIDSLPCQVLAELPPAAPGTNVRTVDVVVHEEYTLADGHVVTCLEGSIVFLAYCSLVVEGDGGGEFQSSNMLFVPMTVSQQHLLDGEPITITARGMAGWPELRLIRCQGLEPTDERGGIPLSEGFDPDRCESPATAPVVPVGTDGRVSVTFPAAQRFQTASGAYRYCRYDDCQVGISLHPDPSDPEPSGVLVPSNYVMSLGSLPWAASELVDGQAVAVTGSGLMPSYDGPPVWFLESGDWSLSQCSDDVLHDMSVFDIFAHCTPLLPGPVPVPGSDLSATVTVRAQITSMLGEPIDCASTGSACVVLLARLEQDGSVSVHPMRLDFAS